MLVVDSGYLENYEVFRYKKVTLNRVGSQVDGKCFICVSKDDLNLFFIFYEYNSVENMKKHRKDLPKKLFILKTQIILNRNTQ